jgi:hypothetical protein
VRVLRGDARRMARRGGALCGTLHGVLPGLIMVTVSLGMAAPAVDAAYRLTFRNGTSVQVQSYEEGGEALRYPRYGGMVTVPRTDVTAIQEVSPPTPPPGPVSPLPVGGFRSPA